MEKDDLKNRLLANLARPFGLYILDGHEVRPTTDLFEWARQSAEQNRIVAKTKVGRYEISTVFLGIDHGLLSGRPQLFETAVFHKGRVEIFGRYATWAEAETGHAAVVLSYYRTQARIKNKRGPNERRK